MSIILPASIEVYLRDAQFTATEILVIRKMIEERSLSLRELASKTGKSTGVLDQAVKKLLGKKIMKREMLNGQPKFTLVSLEALEAWLGQQNTLKKQQLDRQQQNFSTYVTSLQSDAHKPTMEYFEGEEGIRKAYRQLLALREEMLVYLPIDCKEEDDRLREDRLQCFRERHKQKIFQRIIAHDTPLGARYQSRDIFEYRKTLLVPSDEIPIEFEKIIVGDTCACFDHAAQKACFIHYPLFAQTERMAFEMVWKNYHKKPCGACVAEAPSISYKTRFFSTARDMFLNRTFITALALVVVLTGGVTFALYENIVQMNRARVVDTSVAAAATGALQFSAEEIEELKTEADITKPEYATVIGKLDNIRKQNARIKYVYIMRPTDDPKYFAFVADADSLNPYEQRDVNGDGIIDNADHLSPPGELYDVSLLMEDAKRSLVEPHGSTTVYEDQWGFYIAGWAPIRDRTGKTVAVLGTDILADEARRLSAEAFPPLVLFFGFFTLFLLMALLTALYVYRMERGSLFGGRR